MTASALTRQLDSISLMAQPTRTFLRRISFCPLEICTLTIALLTPFLPSRILISFDGFSTWSWAKRALLSSASSTESSMPISSKATH
ncbi:unnamed protein product [Macrosiphum euphorbiae]|uniref:Uncharacterized protein n=1 Tax=Macrosiphum euphorbiae TaxID=13131 RepID=A0AAV0WWI6_9HEMI|nr:unnamed protein product [Macrosiphum euphorbiae]